MSQLFWLACGESPQALHPPTAENAPWSTSDNDTTAGQLSSADSSTGAVAGNTLPTDSTFGQQVSPPNSTPVMAPLPGGNQPGSSSAAPTINTGETSEPSSVITSASNDRAALEALRAFLAQAPATRPALAEQEFATKPLSVAGAREAQALLWMDFEAEVRAERQAEFEENHVIASDVELRYERVSLGDAPAGARALFISMHGGGATTAATNDAQWRNQIALGADYAPENAIWVAPRAPTDDWNMWFKDHIPALFDRLITQFIIFAGVDPNQVYLTGYSAGGDAVYQLGPRMADRWAGAAMSAGHPNDASPLNLRNVPFAIHVGGDDSAFNRNQVAREWGDKLAALKEMDPDGYRYQLEVHAGLGHWMNLEDAVAIPFLQMNPRQPQPKRVVFRQDGEFQPRLYNLRVNPDEAPKGSVLAVTTDGQQVEVTEAQMVRRATLRLSDALLDLDQPVELIYQGNSLFKGIVTRTIATLNTTLREREDPAQVFPAEIPLVL